jgi:hypothetical protein
VHSLEEARRWIGARVDDVYGSRVGQAVDVYVDAEEREVHWIVVRVASDGPLTPVPVQYSIATATHLWVPVTKDLILRAPALDDVRALNRHEELELCFHYGGMQRRGAALRQRPQQATTAVPGSSVPLRP